MAVSRFFTLTLWLFCVVGLVSAFRTGAPSIVCNNGGVPLHLATSSKSLATLPYAVAASSSFYGPNAIITVSIQTLGKPFKGFFVQAFDASTNQHIGEFENSPFAQSVNGGCSGVTHTNNSPKQAVTLIWHAPPNRTGNVRFVATVLESYRNYWTKIVARTV